MISLSGVDLQASQEQNTQDSSLLALGHVQPINDWHWDAKNAHIDQHSSNAIPEEELRHVDASSLCSWVCVSRPKILQWATGHKDSYYNGKPVPDHQEGADV